jgi:metallo-beta-lactamase family protein
MRWLSPLRSTPRRVFVVHGEASSAETFAKRIETEMGWQARAPALDEVVEI